MESVAVGTMATVDMQFMQAQGDHESTRLKQAADILTAGRSQS